MGGWGENCACATSSHMADKDFKMYGEYAGIVDFVGGNLSEEQCTFRDQDEEQGIDFDFGLAHLEDGYGWQSKHLQVERADTISAKMQSSGNASLLLVLGQPPFHVEYVSTTWANEFGWSSEEIMGLDLKFLQGDGAIGINIRALYDVAYTERNKTSDISGYMKSGTMFSCTITCYPIYDTDCTHNSRFLTNIAIEFSNLQMFSDFPSVLLDYGTLSEIGMPLDRRQYSTSYTHKTESEKKNQSLASEDFTFASKLAAECSLSDVVRYMSTSETDIAMALTDRNGKFAYINHAFADLFKLTTKEIIGKKVDVLFHNLTDVQTRDLFPNENNVKLSRAGRSIVTSSPLPLSRKLQKLELSRETDFTSLSRLVSISELRSRSSSNSNSNSGSNSPRLITKKEENEFTAVLCDKRKKTITCRVAVIPIIIQPHSQTIKKIENIHFTICIQNLFLEEMFDEKLFSISKSELRQKNERLYISKNQNQNNENGLEKFLPLENKSSMDSFLSPEVFPFRSTVLPVDDIIWD